MGTLGFYWQNFLQAIKINDTTALHNLHKVPLIGGGHQSNLQT